MKKLSLLFILFLTIIGLASGIAIAETAHKAGDKSHSQPSGEMEHVAMAGKFEHRMIDKQIRAEFQIMSLDSMNMKGPDGATHHVMVKLYDDSDNQQVKDAAGKVKVIGPDKNEQVNSLKNYSGNFAANFTFGNKGKYGIICLVKIGGEKHVFKFWYPHE